MTADQVKGKGFRGALRYNLQKIEQGIASLLDSSFVNISEQAIMNEISMVRVLRPNLAKYFYHTSLNFPPRENLGDEQMKIIARDYLDAMGFEQHQFAIFRHFDADHPHLHILVNRIGYDGSVLTDSKDYQRSEQVLRKLEKQYGLTEVISSRQAQERAMTKNELEMMKRTDAPSVKMKLQVLLKQVLAHKSTVEQFIKGLEAKGINVLFNQAGTGFISGISYGYEGMQFKGAHLGNAYKWQAVKNSISYEQERDRAAIYQANLRTRAGQSAGTEATTNGTGAATKATGNRTVVQQGAGKLQGQIGKANRADNGPAQRSGPNSNQSCVSNPKDRSQRGKNLQVWQSGRQQVGNQALPGSDLIRDLFGADHPAGDMDNGALSQFKKKRKKRKGLGM